jgi:sulfate adenylyltransferase large subunit
LDFALLTDGLRAEREQGITIDVAYRYFSTPKRKFIIADTPGHEQYTRNMATGASTANLAIILVDARHGVLPQSRRHAYIAALLGIPHVVVAVNKMDLVDFSEDVFDRICRDFEAFAGPLSIRDLHFIPISALLGDNVVDRSARMPWFDGASLLHYLETVHIGADQNLTDMRFAVQYVIRPTLDFRGYAGQVTSGVIRKGDPVTVLPSGRTSRVASIVTYDGDMPRAFAPMSVTVCLDDEIDISRGDMLVPPRNLPQVSGRFETSLVWMNEKPLELNRRYLVKHTTQVLNGAVIALRHKVDINTLENVEASELRMNEIGVALMETHKPVFFDPYRQNRATGALILIDPITNETLASGMIIGPEIRGGPGAELSRVTAAERHSRARHWPATVWLRGSLDAAYAAERMLFDRGCSVTVLDGAQVELAQALNAAGLIVICAVSADQGAVGEVTVDAATPEEICRLLESKGILA